MRKEEKNIFKTGRKVHPPLGGCPRHRLGLGNPGSETPPPRTACATRRRVCPFIATALGFLPRCPLAHLSCRVVSSTSPHQPLSSGCASLSEKPGSHSPPLSCPFSPPLLEKVRIGRDLVGVGGAAVPESGNLARWSTGATGRHWDCCFCPVTAHPS